MLRALPYARTGRTRSRAREGVVAALAAILVAERERWVLWLPVALGAGIALYFGLAREPAGWIGPAFAAGLVAMLPVTGRLPVRWPALRPVLVGLLFVALGFGAAQFRTAGLGTPVLAEQVTTVVGGRVVAVEPAARGPRVILEDIDMGNEFSDPVPERVRLRLRSADARVRPGDRLRVPARVAPPPDASYPGGFDFARTAWFARLGGVGFALAPAAITSAAGPRGPWERLSDAIERARVAIATRISDGIDGPAGGVAAALATGQRGDIPEDVRDDMRDSGLAHLLAISGLHLGLVAGFVFALARGGLALWPRAALGWPLKKIAAVTALGAAAVYLMLAGATVPTQRAFLMTAIVLAAILANRTGISLRLVAWAALVILLLRPEALLSVSFQMSFAAVVALVAAYEALAGRFRSTIATSPHARRILFYFAAIAFSSLVASLATAPFAVFHFNRFAPMGLVANLVAVPITALWVMPLEVVALLLMPLGLEGLVLPALGWGVDAVLWVARTVSSWPGAAITVAQPSLAGMIVLAIGGLWLCLWRRRWRCFGVALIAGGLGTAGSVAPPDILVSSDARLIALRTDNGAVHISNGEVSPFVRDVWQRRLGVDEFIPFGTGDALDCDPLGCAGRTAGRTVAVVTDARGFPEECRRADILISTEPVPRDCTAPEIVIGRFDVWRAGAHAIWLDDSGVRTWRARVFDPGRPWMRPARWPSRDTPRN